ncbi:uncharacterized protein Nnp-1 [Anoplolepis gracilipes]|uniref:uncharacterized protein Nnp-1 n=1 Tax=Anoplolepis gracilipes TaxID=354296 RepID=UPI003BA1FF62
MAVRKQSARTRVLLRKDITKMKDKNKMRPIDTKAESKKNLLVAQEIKMARLLANNDKKVRDKVLKRMKKWLTVRSQSSFVFTKADFMSLWKGLFYCMWMSDKMLIQEELADAISKLVHCFDSEDNILLYTSCALRTLAIEWFGIDQYRLDKFAMLVRRILRQTFVVCRDKAWDIKWVQELSQMFLQLFLHSKTALGFNLHMTEIYLEELGKVGDGNIPEDVVHEFIKPFAVYLMTTDDERQMKHIMQYVFRYLIFQSDVGLDYTEKFKAWKKAGFPCTHVDNMEKIEIEENADNENDQLLKSEIQNKSEKVLDPRAGRVDVELPQIPFNAAKIVKMLSTYYFHPTSKAKSRRQLSRLLDEFKELSEGKMPLGVKRVRSYKKDLKKETRKATLRLLQFEKKMSSNNIKKQKRKRSGEAVVSDISYDNLENGNDLELNSSIDTVDSESESIDTTVNAKANLKDTDADIIPHKKQKKKINKETIASDTFFHDNLENEDHTDIMSHKKQKRRKNGEAVVSDISHDNLKNGSHLELNSSTDTINSESESIDTIVDAKTNLKDTDAEIVPCKKRKRNLTFDKFDNKHVINEDKKKPKTKEKLNKTKNIKLVNDQVDDLLMTDNNIKCKPKKKVILKKRKDQCTFISPVSKKTNLLKEARRSKKSSVLKQTTSEKNVIHNNQRMLLKDELSNQTKKQTNLNNSLEKKKVVFSLFRNTAQHTSEYLQQIRKSPAIPFDANKKPLASVLKPSPISSPLNPFYRRKI